MTGILIGTMVLLYTFQSAFCNLYARHYPGERAFSSPVFSVFYGVTVTAGTLLLYAFRVPVSSVTLWMGTVNGTVLVLYNMFLIRAAALGPFSITKVFSVSGGILIPLIWSVLHDGEKLSVWQIAAILLMVFACVMMNLSGQKEKVKISLRFLLTITLLACVNGCYGILVNTQQRVMEGTENAGMILVTFASSALLGLALLAFTARRKTFAAFRQTKKSALFALISSVSACAAIHLLMYLLSAVSAPVLYAINNGGILVVTVFWSRLILKEKLTPAKAVWLCLIVCAIVALSLL